jgi:hypothetical protein
MLFNAVFIDPAEAKRACIILSLFLVELRLLNFARQSFYFANCASHKGAL